MLSRSIASRLCTPPPLLFTSAKSRLCSQCLHRRRYFSSARDSLGGGPTAKKLQYYFLPNNLLRRDRSSNISVVRENGDPLPADLLPPHRRRRKPESAGAAAHTIPPDASSLLSTSSAASKSRLRRECLAYLSLSKPRLTALIVLTTMSAYAIFPVDPLLSSPAAPTLSALTLLYLTAGTTLCSSSANALNMAFEPRFDGQMSRTRNRPIVRGLISVKQAVVFASITGTLGVTALHMGVNPTVAALGALNIFLYAGVYTPMKRVSVANTWVGAVVGGIPPLMGWAAASGAVALDGGPAELLAHPGGWLLAALLFAWQFPHFNALSWTIRDEYKRAGYQMMVWKYPKMNARVALRYSLAFFPICFGLWWWEVTDVGFLADSSVVNGWLVREAWRFYRKGGDGGRARGLFWASVWHLPLLLGLAMAHKVGMWRGVWERIVGTEDEWEWEDEEEGGETVGKTPMKTVVVVVGS